MQQQSHGRKVLHIGNLTLLKPSHARDNTVSLLEYSVVLSNTGTLTKYIFSGQVS
jgi:hypothetical protein